MYNRVESCLNDMWNNCCCCHGKVLLYKICWGDLLDAFSLRSITSNSSSFWVSSITWNSCFSLTSFQVRCKVNLLQESHLLLWHSHNYWLLLVYLQCTFYLWIDDHLLNLNLLTFPPLEKRKSFQICILEQVMLIQYFCIDHRYHNMYYISLVLGDVPSTNEQFKKILSNFWDV